jgi:hypothetical protein
MADTVKVWYKSKTVWFNIVTGALAIVNAYSQTIPNQYSAIIVGVGNIILRFLTTAPVSLN